MSAVSALLIAVVTARIACLTLCAVQLRIVCAVPASASACGIKSRAGSLFSSSPVISSRRFSTPASTPATASSIASFIMSCVTKDSGSTSTLNTASFENLTTALNSTENSGVSVSAGIGIPSLSCRIAKNTGASLFTLAQIPSCVAVYLVFNPTL
ncbi:MAG: hypothetical protein LBC86_04960 [Oscillospiraceae bacterium]|nr:hypothetical protein [Oscillospiraceae bacterium]